MRTGKTEVQWHRRARDKNGWGEIRDIKKDKKGIYLSLDISVHQTVSEDIEGIRWAKGGICEGYDRYIADWCMNYWADIIIIMIIIKLGQIIVLDV